MKSEPRALSEAQEQGRRNQNLAIDFRLTTAYTGTKLAKLQIPLHDKTVRIRISDPAKFELRTAEFEMQLGVMPYLKTVETGEFVSHESPRYTTRTLFRNHCILIHLHHVKFSAVLRHGLRLQSLNLITRFTRESAARTDCLS